MRLRRHSPALAAIAALAVAAPAAAQPTRVPLDHEKVVGGIGVGCTGIGQTKNDPKWLAYNVRVEFADAQHNYLAGEVVTLLDNHGQELLEVSCEGPWVLLKLQAGMPYLIEGQVKQNGVAPVSSTVSPPSHGQTHVVLTFPNAH
jgi:hypothetical protein